MIEKELVIFVYKTILICECRAPVEWVVAKGHSAVVVGLETIDICQCAEDAGLARRHLFCKLSDYFGICENLVKLFDKGHYIIECADSVVKHKCNW